MFRKKLHRQAFTLIEMVISMGIFMIFITAIFSSYIQITNLQRRTNLSRENMAEARELITYITNETKEKAIDYKCYTESSDCPSGFVGNTVEEISLVSKDGLNRTIIRKRRDVTTQELYLSSQTQSRQSNTQDLWLSNPEKRLHSPSLKFDSITFQITPNQDPFSDDLSIVTNNNLQYQPIIHLNFNIHRKDSKSDKPIVLETSISSRIYHSI